MDFWMKSIDLHSSPQISLILYIWVLAQQSIVINCNCHWFDVLELAEGFER